MDNACRGGQTRLASRCGRRSGPDRDRSTWIGAGLRPTGHDRSGPGVDGGGNRPVRRRGRCRPGGVASATRVRARTDPDRVLRRPRRGRCPRRIGGRRRVLAGGPRRTGGRSGGRRGLWVRLVPPGRGPRRTTTSWWAPRPTSGTARAARSRCSSAPRCSPDPPSFDGCPSARWRNHPRSNRGTWFPATAGRAGRRRPPRLRRPAPPTRHRTGAGRRGGPRNRARRSWSTAASLSNRMDTTNGVERSRHLGTSALSAPSWVRPGSARPAATPAPARTPSAGP